MKKIRNKKDLLEERLRLKLELIAAEESLKEDLEWVKEEIKPYSFVTKFFKGSKGKNTDGIIDSGIGLTIESILRNIVFAKAGWLTKIIVPILIKNFSTGILSDKKPELYGVLRNFIKKARRSLRDDKEYYDKSTVDEMDY